MRLVDPDAKERQALANATANLRRVFADSAGEDHGIQAAEHRRQRTQPYPGSVAEQLDSLGGTNVPILPRQKIAEVGAGFRHTEQAGLMIDQVVELVNSQPLRPHQEPDQAGVDITTARAHD